MDKKEKLLANIEYIKQNIENDKVTNLVIIGCNEQGDITTKIAASGIAALGLAELLKIRVKKQVGQQIQQHDFKELLDTLIGDN